MNDYHFKVYESDASSLRGRVFRVIIPKNLSELKNAIIENKRVVVRGAGTGLCGGCVPNSDDVVIDMSKLDRIENIDVSRKTIEVEAGVILDDLQNFLEPYGLEFPINPSSHSICTIGGMISTNAVGSRAIKYGKTSQWIRWIDVVDGYGNVQRKGVTELSDYVGMEGISGVIYRACLNLSPRVSRSATLFSFDDLIELINRVRELKKNPNVSMAEFVDKKISSWIGLDEKYNLIVEYESNEGVLKGSDYQLIMSRRDKIYPMLAKQGYDLIEDPKVMIEKIDKIILWLESKGIPVFGHIGVGVIHPCFNLAQREKYLKEFMLSVKKLGGFVTGEHGIGILKKDFVDIGDKKIIENVKKRTDPLLKFNIGKVI